jgi:HEAT repeat protein
MRNSFAFINPELKKQRAPTEITSVIELRSSNATFEESPHMPNAIDLSATVTLLQKMAQDEFVAGETSESERCIEKTSETYGWPDTMRWLNTVYLDNFSNPAVLIGLMHCLSHFEYDDVKPEGPTMALGVLQHSDIFVRDYAIRAFENWGDKEAIPILKSLSCDAKWLQEYINEVVKELEEQ